MKRRMAFVVLTLAVLFSGCATTQSQGSLATMPTATTAREVNPGSLGHPFRYLAFVLHPAGVVTDYVLFRPAMVLFSAAPEIFGWTQDDADAFAKHVGSQ